MNRRQFLRLSALVPLALVTKLEVSPEKFEIISPSETFNKAFEAFSKGYENGYRWGQEVMEGYAEGMQGLTHFNCPICEKWWSIGDAPERDHWYCPWCGEHLVSDGRISWEEYINRFEVVPLAPHLKPATRIFIF